MRGYTSTTDRALGLCPNWTKTGDGVTSYLPTGYKDLSIAHERKEGVAVITWMKRAVFSHLGLG